MRVLFLEIDTERSWAVASLGPAFIASYLRKHGHEVDFLRVPLDAEREEVVRRVAEFAPGLLGLSLTTRQWLRARNLVAEIRRVVDVPVVAGGLHPTFSGEEVLACPGFDFVCLGEGEEAMLDLAEALENGEPTNSIRNIQARGCDRPTLRPPFEPLDDLPYMARDFLDESNGCVYVNTQRGCPFPCTYCGARKYHDLYKGIGSYGRRRSHQNVIDELLEIRRTGELNYVIFLDDTFTINKAWVKEFCGIYAKEIGVPFSIHARVETVDPDLIEDLAAAGCRHITYGVESGSFRIRKEVMRRPVQNQQFIDVFRWTEEAGIMITANYMLGLPEETREDIDQTLELAEQLNAYDFGYFVFYPYPGTHLFHYCRDQGYLPDDYLDREANHRESILTLPTLSQADIGEYYDRFTALRARLYERRVKETVGAAANGETLEAATGHVRDLAQSG